MTAAEAGVVLGVDYGASRIGLAVSDPSGAIALPLEVLRRRKGHSLVRDVLDVAEQKGATRIVVGLPLALDGTKGGSATSAEAFAQALGRRTSVPVVLWDERLTTVEASRRLQDAGQSARQQRGLVDKHAACLMLGSYLESLRAGGARTAG
ncbi:MAG TPA: Holliday junction resolvase RuvX [Actinomycetota bacterium]|nr:Holliday junction resolvase RuvX [Actinomycetota bacterium]